MEPSAARQGLNLLLASTAPVLDVVSVEWQPEGPWILVSLGQRSETFEEHEAWALHPYAIWKQTGAVHGIGPDGAVTDDPVLVP
jgi:hypothetical protein